MNHISKVSRRQALVGGVCMAAAAGGGAWQTGFDPSRPLFYDAFVKAAAQKAKERLSARVKRGEIPALVALIGRGDKSQLFTLGEAQPDSIFRIASMSKPIAALATMMLVEDGKLKLDEPVDRLLPELAHRRVLKRLDAEIDDTVPALRPIHVEDLLTFKCGLGVILAPPERYPILKRIAEAKILGFGAPDPAATDGYDEWLRKLATLPLMAQPGTRWQYGLPGYLLGPLIARAAGIPLSDFVHERIFQPLKMNDTAFWVDADDRERLVDAYAPTPQGLKPTDSAKLSAWNARPVYEDAAAGLLSTAKDYLAFSQFLLRRGVTAQGARLLNEVNVQAMTKDQLSAEQRADGSNILGEGRGWGYGMAVVSAANAGRLPIGSVGWNGGLGTSWMGDLRTNTTAVLLTQVAFTSPQSPPAHQEFWQAVFD